VKEIISAAILIVSLFAGTHYLKEIHDGIRKAALEKAASGLPSLRSLNSTVHRN
jgi:hypothetical protein